VRVDVEAAAPVPLEAVAAEVKAILQALVVNACEASSAGGRTRVTVRRDSDGRARVEVEDEGSGIPPEVRDRLFAPHVTTKPHGSGMGLFLAQRLASGRYGGELELAPRAGGGTRATVRLAARRPGERT
jgi:signal transduction histidine kinase